MTSIIPSQSPRNATMHQCLIAGAIAGTTVDACLFPLDTIKTRIQSVNGLMGSGGFRGIFAGLLPAVIGSAPGAGAFFLTYEYCKALAHLWIPPSETTKSSAHLVHMIAASLGEISACVVRVPTEVVKQRLQAGQYPSTFSALRSIVRIDGLLGFYRGYMSTIMREIPFTCIQFPIYEYLKQNIARRKRHVHVLDAGLCGSVSGGIAAAITTPLDTANVYVGMIATLKSIVMQEGVLALFKGIGPRTLWIGLGGFVFLGAYEKAKQVLVDQSTYDE